jgi:hypothetical protein
MTKRKPLWTKVARELLGKTAEKNIGDGSDGNFAIVTPCRGVGFSLWATREAAEKFKVRLDRRGCCGGCWPKTHYIVDLSKTTLPKRRSSQNTIARKHFGKSAVYGGGDGPFAFVTPCRVLYYTLWETRKEAAKVKVKVDKRGCGGECKPWTHYIVDLGEAK